MSSNVEYKSALQHWLLYNLPPVHVMAGIRRAIKSSSSPGAFKESPQVQREDWMPTSADLTGLEMHCGPVN